MRLHTLQENPPPAEACLPSARRQVKKKRRISPKAAYMKSAHAILLLILPLLVFAQADAAQNPIIELPPCSIASDSIDPFDSLRTVMSDQIALGFQMISQYETTAGPRLIAEAQAAVIHTELDSLSVLFLQLELPEYSPQRTANDYNVKFKMASDTIIGFYTVSDRGHFSRQTNMRHYQHLALVPTDLYYMLTYDLVDLIRVDYKSGQQRTIKLNSEQQILLREYFRCVGERVGYYPVSP
ncbi:MAG: hypothetical protein AAF741_10480 [Bacteroidota bacterium]